MGVFIYLKDIWITAREQQSRYDSLTVNSLIFRVIKLNNQSATIETIWLVESSNFPSDEINTCPDNETPLPPIGQFRLL